MGIVTSARSAVVAASLLTAAGVVQAQVPPVVRLVVGYAAGGPVDQAARLVAPYLAKELGTTIVVDNKPGANAVTAGDMVAKSAPDGAVLWFGASPTITISPNVMTRMPFDPATDLTPLAPILSYYNVLVVNRDMPYRTMKDLVDFARANPGRVTYGSAGVGGSNHLCGELLAERTGTKMLHVPYKGNAPAMADVIGGQLTMMFDIVGTAKPYIASDKVRAIAVTSPRRNPSLPNVPTMAEAGVKDFDVGGWYAVYGPPKMRADVAARYTAAFASILRNPDLKGKLEGAGYELWTGGPEVVDARGRRERAMWATVTKDIKIE